MTKNLNSNGFIHEFVVDHPDNFLMWHHNNFDMLIEVLDGIGWIFQIEKTIPRELFVGDKIWIPAYSKYKITQGTSNLVLKIIEENK